MKEIINSILSQYGKEILLDGNRFCSVVSDLAPQFKKENKIIRRLNQEMILPIIYHVLCKQPIEVNGINRLDVFLNESGFSEDWKTIVYTLFSLPVLINDGKLEADNFQKTYDGISDQEYAAFCTPINTAKQREDLPSYVEEDSYISVFKDILDSRENDVHNDKSHYVTITPNDLLFNSEIGCYSYTENEKNIRLSNDFKEIGKKLFYKNAMLEKVIIPDTVNKIGPYAFADCKNLKSVILPKSLVSIDECAFHENRSLEKIDIPDSVTEIGDFAFGFCINLKTISLSNSLTKIENRVFWRNDSIEKIVIPDSVTEIGDYAFEECKNLKLITLSNNLKTIGKNAFGENLSLEQIVIPDSVSIIGERAFCFCYNLKKCILSNSIKIIEDGVFQYDRSLEQIRIPDSVIEIGSLPFAGCSNLRKMYISKNVIKFNDLCLDDLSNCVFYIHRFSKVKSFIKEKYPNYIIKYGKF